jgi:hypothetical protein
MTVGSKSKEQAAEAASSQRNDVEEAAQGNGRNEASRPDDERHLDPIVRVETAHDDTPVEEYFPIPR